ncbi:hypothetical protein L873DRAFT_63339 [Choiromyces venosus 120613-1]|uniref:Uncharacterized protein n=1 Tax=Choiromyces venosus 120613-1 TaxID=1336337 RepID=A0A3N4J565_9PEZI|nr:hypothetical protein L873DRAFT_63339 [Choiromyces venosus 120613-1]
MLASAQSTSDVTNGGSPASSKQAANHQPYRTLEALKQKNKIQGSTQLNLSTVAFLSPPSRPHYRRAYNLYPHRHLTLTYSNALPYLIPHLTLNHSSYLQVLVSRYARLNIFRGASDVPCPPLPPQKSTKVHQVSRQSRNQTKPLMGKNKYAISILLVRVQCSILPGLHAVHSGKINHLRRAGG